MSYREDQERAAALLTEFIQLSQARNDALPDSAVELVRKARRVMRTRRLRPGQYHRAAPELEEIY